MDGPRQVSHDQNFKNLIIDYPLQAIELFSPEEAEHIYSALDDNEMAQYKAQYPQESNTMATLSERLRAEAIF